MFIVLEGVDAAGKATQSKIIADKLMYLGREVYLYSFPRYETPVGKIILDVLKGDVQLMRGKMSEHRQDPVSHHVHEVAAEAMALQTLMTADKYDAAVEIERHLRLGRDIVCDRWAPSAECYGVADGLDHDWLKRIQNGLTKADFYFYIEVSEEEALRRRPKLRDRFERDRAKQEIIRNMYRGTWIKNADVDAVRGRWIIIDGHGTQEEVTKRIWDEIVAYRGIL